MVSTEQSLDLSRYLMQRARLLLVLLLLLMQVARERAALNSQLSLQKGSKRW
jgi:hypothetical protein